MKVIQDWTYHLEKAWCLASTYHTLATTIFVTYRDLNGFLIQTPLHSEDVEDQRARVTGLPKVIAWPLSLETRMLITSTPCCPLGQWCEFDSRNSNKILAKDSSLAHYSMNKPLQIRLGLITWLLGIEFYGHHQHLEWWYLRFIWSQDGALVKSPQSGAKQTWLKSWLFPFHWLCDFRPIT